MSVRVFRKKGSGRYWLDVRSPGGRQRFPVATSEKAAKESAARIEVQIADGTYRGHKVQDADALAGRGATFGQLAETWLSLRKNGSPATLASYRDLLRRWQAEIPADTKVESLSPARVLKAAAGIKGDPAVGKVRWNRYRFVLRSLMRLAEECNLVDRDPSRSLKRNLEPKREFSIEAGDLDAMLARLDENARPAAVLAYCTGARRGDLLGSRDKDAPKSPLSWCDVDLRGRTVTFRQRKEGREHVAELALQAVEVLLSLPSRHRWEAEKRQAEAEDRAARPVPVFADARGKPLNPDWLLRQLKAAAEAVGIPDARRLRVHDLRHLFCSTLLDTGANLEDVRRAAGHSSLAVTQRYLHRQKKHLRAAVERLPRLVGGTIGAPSAESAVSSTSKEPA